MSIDFPIGTRLSFNNRTLEIAEDGKGVEDCRQCALRYAREECFDVYLCASTRCVSLSGDERRADGKTVHWALVEDSI